MDRAAGRPPLNGHSASSLSSTTESSRSSAPRLLPRNMTSAAALPPALLALALAPVLFIAALRLSHSAVVDPDRYEPTAQMPFNLSNAINHVSQTGKSLRFVKSLALEHSVQYTYEYIRSLKSAASENNMRLEVDVFRSDPGSYDMALSLLLLRHSYDNITSVVARLSPADATVNTDSKTLMINAHIDSAISAPGASDNLSGVGITLEILRVLATLPTHVNRLKRPVVFLFNAAEEVVLQGAHSFMTQHPWGTNIAAHINLESIGSGSKYYLFRQGPRHPWLAQAYARAVSVPFGTVCATDIFETKVSFRVPFAAHFRPFRASVSMRCFFLIANPLKTYSSYTSPSARPALHCACISRSFQQRRTFAYLTRSAASLASTLLLSTMGTCTTLRGMTLTI